MKFVSAFILASLIALTSMHAAEEEKVNAIVMLNMENGQTKCKIGTYFSRFARILGFL
jgi:hypothetical protein